MENAFSSTFVCHFEGRLFGKELLFRERGPEWFLETWSLQPQAIHGFYEARKQRLLKGLGYSLEVLLLERLPIVGV
ncbi:MAG: hypothetical protein MJE68_26435 [Proteobacteria bacterium]|nr:hypothetical protein [Pseudomonadota bacterium]